MSPSLSASENGPGRPWFDDDVTDVEDQPAEAAGSLVSLGFFTAALRRSKWLWCTTAVVGLLVGSGLYLRAPHTYQASTKLMLYVGAEAQPGTAILEDQAMAQSRAMAGLTLQKLGLQESSSSFLSSYTVTPLTDQILKITDTAPSSNEAVRRAKELATEFLAFRADQLREEQQLQFAAFDQQISQDKQHLASISNQLSQLPVSSPQRARLAALRAQGITDLTALEQQVSQTKAGTKVGTDNLIGGSYVLDPASPDPPHSRLKHLLIYAGGGFILGLILGVIIVVLRALLSDRLFRRDDIARALGAPVKLSVPAMGASGWLPGRRGRVSDRYLQRVVAYLRDAVPADSSRTAALAVVAVDDPRVVAQSVVSLAEACAQQGRRVVVADLCSGAPAAMLLGAKDPGVHTASMDGVRLVAAVPNPAEFAPVGPLRPTSPKAQPADAGELAAACASADLLLTLITLDPSVGGDHLATWAPEAIVMVTAGRSSWTKIHAVGEMIRLADTRLVSAVLIGADKTDESLGVTPAPDVGTDAVTTPGMRANAKGALTGGRGGRPSHPDAAEDSLQADVPFAAAPVAEPFGESPASRLQMDRPEHGGHRRRTGR
jgi:capsular polysaccharide biosynthesis protein